ncbi:CHASE domain-containing protein [Pseudoduganella umbonata]|uniref:histidine kinase n=1 Tax=Pseudoduganella umbonata TaxID=864828 RepID=A0A4P8HQ75_9BURK|nr:CHASE domain-containing protein [Pseudoduganella umbonata]MBB3221574.1 PAS domain S-box-containing protein [Pseudoduganella umbonata]QCP10712.1 response regulator [Pseudoduganella umbonata]
MPTSAYLPPPPGRAARLLPLALALAALCAGLAATALVWDGLRDGHDREARAEFDYRVRELQSRIARRMATYEQVLRGAQAYALAAPPLPDAAGFRTFIGTLQLREYYPGIQGVGIAMARGDAGSAIEMIEPLDTMNRRALGYDMFAEPVRRTAMARARDSGAAALTGRVRLVQEGSGAGQPGFLMYLPLYAAGANGQPADVAARRQAFRGWVYGAFRMHDFMSGLNGEREADLHVTVYDAAPDPASCMYGCAYPEGAAHLDELRTIAIAGRPWILRVRSNPVFEQRLASQQAAWAGVSGIIVSMLSATLVWLLAQGRDRARQLARRITDDLQRSYGTLRNERSRLVSILDNANDAFVAVDAAGHIIYWNPQAERIFGWTVAEALGRPLRHLFPGEQPELDRLLAFDDAAFENGRGRRLELLAATREGLQLPVELSCSRVDSDGAPVLHGFIRDLTARHAALARETQRQRDLQQAQQALERARKLEAVGKLTGGVAHDFNNVLQVIYGNVQAAAMAPRSPEAPRRLAGALAAVERGANLSRQLLAFARRQPLEPVVINLARLLRNIGDLLHRALGEGVELATHVEPGLWNTRADPNQLENVVLNLAINARDAMAGHGRLTIELSNQVLDEDDAATVPDAVAGDYVLLAVSDTGSGMPPEVQERVFEPFFTTKPEGEGTGLGLSMAYGFVRQTGGHIRIDSEVGVGTTMRLYFPRSGAPEAAQPDLPPPATGGTETILLVDDDADVRDTVGAMLRSLRYTVLEAADADAALGILRSAGPVDLLFTDVVMPGGLPVAELARLGRQLRPGLAVLFTSGYTQDAAQHGSQLEPGTHLLSKPYRRDELARKVRAVLDERSTPPPPPPAPQRVLVVEDNDDLRDLTCEMIIALGWQATGVGSAEAALESLQAGGIGAVFTDVELPGMSGLELARRLADDPDLPVVVVSGRALGNDVPPGVRSLYKPYRIDAVEEILAQLRLQRQETSDPDME